MSRLPHGTAGLERYFKPLDLSHHTDDKLQEIIANPHKWSELSRATALDELRGRGLEARSPAPPASADQPAV